MIQLITFVSIFVPYLINNFLIMVKNRLKALLDSRFKADDIQLTYRPTGQTLEKLSIESIHMFNRYLNNKAEMPTHVAVKVAKWLNVQVLEVLDFSSEKEAA